jgi:radical SAM protein with 4Fe4S-binding SPASM domain
VLSGRNQGAMKTIFEFYKLRGLSFRLLPLENGLYGSSSAFGLTARDILRALCELADLWFEDPCIEIEPLKRCLKMMGYAAANPDNRALLYDLNRWNAVQMIDVDGELYTYPDRFKTERSMGNLFNTSLTNIFASASHAAAAARANRRMDSACLTCPYLGRSCDGSPMADGEMGFGEYREDGSEVCVVTKGLLKHLETRLQQANLLSTGAVRREMS